MKKITLFLFALFSCWQISAQVSSYGFSHFLGSYIENSASATAIPGVRADSFISTAQNIGFDFVYDGVTYTQFKMSSNGFISLNMSGTSSLTANDLSAANATSRPIIAPLWDDLDGGDVASSVASYELSGVAPNRVLTVEWRNWQWNYNATTNPVISFQVKLYETTNIIDFIYRQEVGAIVSGSASVGIGSATGSGAGSYLSLSNVATPAVSSTTSTNTLNTKPATGQVYRFTPPSCSSPSGFAVSNLTTTSATISWNAAVPVPSTGYEYYYSDVNTAPTGAGTPINALTANLAGLNAATTYYVWLRSDCGGTFSAWNGPYSFRTLCDAFSIPFTETFDSTSSTEACWTVLNVNADADAWNLSYATTPITGNQSAMIYTDGGNGTNDDWLITPKITLNGNQRLLFKYKVQSSTEPNDFRIMLSTTGTAPADFTTTLMPLTAFSNTTAETRVISLSGISGDVYIGYHVPAGGLDGWRLYIDDVTVEDIPVVAPTCSTITFPSNGALNVTNSRVTWSTSLDATGYRISVGYGSGTTEVLNSFDVGNVLSYTFPYEAATTYYVTVYPYNAFGVATGCSEISFTTCDEIGDFSENFDALTATGQIPSCWSRVISNGASAFASVGTSSTNNSAPYSISLYNDSSPATANIMLVTPYINNIDAGTNRLRFFARNSTASQDIQVGTMSNPADASTFTVLQTVDLGTTFQEYSVSFAGYTGTDKYIAIRRLSTSTYTYVYIDNAVWEAIPAVAPTCSTITSPTTGAINVMNSRVSWSSSVDATGYKINVGYSSGATDVLNMFDVGNVLAYTIPTDPGTTYYVTVFPYNATGTATGCSEISFTTCDVLNPDILETFDTFLPSCWQEADGGNTTAGPVTFGSGPWSSDGFGNSGTTGALKINLDYLNDNGWIISPVISIPTSGYELKYDAAATQYAQTVAPTTAWESDDFVEVLVSTSGMNNWTVLYTYNNTNVPATTGTNNIIDLDAYAGMDVRFAFRGVEGTTDGGADIDFFIDNFNVRLTPASAPSCATNIVATPNATCGNFATVITWDAAVSADGYNIAIGTTPGTGNVFSGNLGNVLTYSFIGNIGTTYYYTIVPYNAFGSATGCAEQSFTTNANGCYCSSAPTSVDGDGITNILLGSVNFPNTVSTSPVYNDHTATVVDMSSGVNNNVQISFNVPSWEASYDYNTVVWIDVNDNFAFEASEIVFTGVSPTNVAPTSLNASFVMPSTVPLGQHRMRIVATDNAQNPANPCYSGTYGETADFTVNIVAASCTPPAATTTVVPACGTAQYSIDVNVTALGSGTPSITDGTTTWPVSAIGVVNVGPFASGSSVTLTLLHGSDATCNLPLGSFNYACPPANDNCANAVSLTVNPDFSCGTVTAGTTQSATDSGIEPTFTVTGTPDNDVWYSFVATGTAHRISLLNIVAVTGFSTDMGIAVFDGTGTCSALTLVGSSDPETYNLTGLTPGTTYYVAVYGWGAAPGAVANFNICVGTPPAPPANDECANAIAISSMPYSNTQDASAATGPVVSTCTGMNDGVWYTVVGNGADIIIDVTAVTGWDPELGIYTGSCGTFTCVDSIDDEGTSVGETYTIVASTLGTTYYINVGHYSDSGDSPEGPFTIDVTTTLSSDSFDSANFTAYPNPVKDVLNVSYSTEISSIRVINMIGQEVISKTINATSSQVDMSQLSAGTYIVNVTVGDAVKTLKVVKQ